MKFVKGVCVGDFDVKHPDTGEEVKLHVWMNPETRSLVAVGNMDYVQFPRNYVNDPYVDGVVFDDTYSGLPK